MYLKKLTASVGTAGLLGLGGLGLATGLAQADPPANPGNSNGQGQSGSNGQGNLNGRGRGNH